MDESERLRPGEGPTRNISVSLHEGTINALREITDKRGVSSFVEEALARAIERHNLGTYLDWYEQEHGAFTPEELAAARADLYGDDPDQAVA